MKKSLLILMVLAAAASSAADLKARAREERSWLATELRLEESADQTVGKGYVTNNQTWRIESLAPQMEVTAPLTSKDASEMGIERFNRLCRKMGYGFIAAREQQRPQKLTLRVPDWKLAPAGDVHLRTIKDAYPLSVAGNAPRIVQVRSRVAFDDKANTLLYSNLDPRVIERLIEIQVQSQIDKLRSHGAIEIDIRGHDYVACDYTLGLVRVALEVIWEYPAAKLKREPTVAAGDIQQAISSSKAIPLEGDCTTKGQTASGILSVNLNQATHKTIPEMGTATYLTLLNAIYDQNQCRWREQGIDVSALASEFDALSERLVQNSVVVFTRFNGVVQ